MATTTASFGAGKRESHDASMYYGRRMSGAAPVLQTTGLVHDPPAKILDKIFCQSSESMTQIPDGTVALMVTSPPYNVGKEYDEDLTLDAYLDLLHRVFTETYRALEAGGRVAVNVANLGRKPYLALNHHVARLLEDVGFLLRGEIIWQKAKGAGGSCAWGSWQSAKNPTLRDLHEYIIVGCKESFSRQRKGDDSISKEDFMDATLSVWNIAPASAKRVGHPAPFPVELPKRLIELYTFEGDLVLDPFMGAGATAIAAQQIDRHYVGYEISPEYRKLALSRIESATSGGVS